MEKQRLDKVIASTGKFSRRDYDLESILDNAGITTSEKNSLKEALNGCVVYKGATPAFMNEFTIDTFSGFSMYLPCNGSNELNKYYKTLKWNKTTGLVK